VSEAADLSAAVEGQLAAAREGDFEAPLEVLDPDVVLRADRGAVQAIGAGPATLGLLVASFCAGIVVGLPWPDRSGCSQAVPVERLVSSPPSSSGPT
jgi:hypothetical protein